MKALFSIWAASLCDTVSALGIASNSWQGKTPKVIGILWSFSNVSSSVDVVGKKCWGEARVSSAPPSCLLSWCFLLSFLGQEHAGSCCEISLYLTTSLLLLSEREHHSLALQVSVHRAPLPAQPRLQQHPCYHSLAPQAVSESCWVAQTSGSRHLPQHRSMVLQPASRVACAGGCTLAESGPGRG